VVATPVVAVIAETEDRANGDFDLGGTPRLAGGVGGQTNTILLASMMGVAGPSFAAHTVCYLLAGGICLLGAIAVLVGGAGVNAATTSA
jgi:hypothetical protein